MSFFTLLLDNLLPPRGSERVVRELSVTHLHAIASPVDGTLPYHDPRVTALVWELKYRANKRACALAGEFLAEAVLGIAGEELGKPLLIPIPIHNSRRKKRGHNQTELLCEALMRHLEDTADYAPRALVRTVNTRPQQGLERSVRLTNVRNSMEANPQVAHGRVCIVVDDVTTTGATLKEASRALRSAGARRVHSIALAQS